MNNESQEDDEIIPVSVAGNIIPIARSQIRWVEAHRNFVRLHTHKQSYLWRETLNHLEEQWEKYGFVRIHRARLVHLPSVTDIRRNPSGYSARIGSDPDAEDLQISRRRLKKFKQQWDKTTPAIKKQYGAKLCNEI